MIAGLLSARLAKPLEQNLVYGGIEPPIGSGGASGNEIELEQGGFIETEDGGTIDVET